MEDNNQPNKKKFYEKFKVRNPRKVLIIFVIVLSIFTILDISGIYFFSKNTKSTQITPKDLTFDNPLVKQVAEKLPIPKITITIITPMPGSTSTITPTAQSAKVNTQNWKTYNNTNLNLSFSYPSNLTVKENEHGFGVADITLSSTDNPDDPEYQILTYPDIVDQFIGQDFNTLYDLPPNTTVRMSSEAMDPQIYTKISNRTISGHRAFDFEATDDPPDPSIEPEAGAYIELGTNRMIISTRQENRATLNQMLSTLKP